MAINCPKCNATNQEEAKFCDQCGATLTATEAPAAPAAAGPATNWWAITAIVVIIGVLIWLFAGPKDNAPAPGGNGNAANPHAEMGGANGDNPHGMDAQSGMPDIEGLKAKLEANPLDLQTLTTLYQTYGMIGRGTQMRSYLDKTLAEIEAQQETLGDTLAETGRGAAIAALMGGDAEGAINVLNKVQELVPEDLEAIQLLAEVYFSIDEPEKSIEWFTRYLDSADPEAAGEQYVGARASRAKMQIRLFEKSEGNETHRSSLDTGIAELEAIRETQPEDFNIWLELGKGYGLQEKVTLAEEAFEKCLDLAKNEQQYWQAEAALAVLHGEEPPEQPAPPSGGMGSMGNPHGGMGSGSGDMGGNPHGAMGSPKGSAGGGETGSDT